MDDLKPFQEQSKCPKCGVVAIHDMHFECQVLGTFRSREVLKRTCTRCGYSWHEVPADGGGEFGLE